MWTAPHDLLHKAEAMTMDAEQNALLDIQSMMYPKLSSNENVMIKNSRKSALHAGGCRTAPENRYKVIMV